MSQSAWRCIRIDMQRTLLRIAVTMVLVSIAVVFGLFAFNFYRNYTGGEGLDHAPPVIFERTDRPSRA